MDQDLEALYKSCTVDEDGYSGLLFVGLMSNRVSIATQQQRCFNLAASLKRKFPRPTDIKVAVVGAGISGVTISAALKSLGFDIYLFDKERAMIDKQSTEHRSVHPTINFWPLESYILGTTFPFCNWVSGSAGNVRTQIISNFEPIATELTRNGKYVNRVNVEKVLKDSECSDINRYNLLLTDSKIYGPYEVVILCTGYGDETDLLNSRDEYWTSGPIWPKPTLENVNTIQTGKAALSGTGDGALIDLISSLYSSYNGNIIEEAVDKIERSQIFFDDLVSLERKVIPLNENNSTFSANMYSLYSELNIPADINSFLNDAINSSMPEVHYFHQFEYPISKYSSPIHRLIHFILHQFDSIKIKYIRANYVREKESFISHTGKEYSCKEFNFIRIRHGVRRDAFPIIDGLSTKSIEKLASNQLLLDYESAKPKYNLNEYYETEYFPNPDRNIIEYFDVNEIKIGLLTDKTSGIYNINLNSSEDKLDIIIENSYSYLEDRYNESRIFGFNSRSILKKDYEKQKNHEGANASHCLHHTSNGYSINADTDRNILFDEFSKVNSSAGKTDALPIFFVTKTLRHSFMSATLGPRLDLSSISNNTTDVYIVYTGDIEIEGPNNLSVFTISDNKLVELGIANFPTEDEYEETITNQSVVINQTENRLYPKNIMLVTHGDNFELTPPSHPVIHENDTGDIQHVDMLRENELVVKKEGFMSGNTRGKIVYPAGAAKLVMEDHKRIAKELTYINVITIQNIGEGPFSISGDSGAAICEEKTGKVVGTVLGGNEYYTIALNIPRLMFKPSFH